MDIHDQTIIDHIRSLVEPKKLVTMLVLFKLDGQQPEWTDSAHSQYR